MLKDLTKDTLTLGSFGTQLNAAVIGASGGIGGALVDDLERCQDVSSVYRFSRSNFRCKDIKKACFHLDIANEESIAEAAAAVEKTSLALNLVIVATGILHDGDCIQPEKTWRALRQSAMETAFRINAIGPALVAKHFLPLLPTDRKTAFAVLSARVGSIEDNHLGGWHAYRASKAALNMLIKRLSIELSRRNTKALCVALHPGTVDTALSEPFKIGVLEGNLFSPAQSARYLLTVLERLTPHDSGGHYAWDGSRIRF
jgi:NAD(P)-dependent dehydrogenase (short-subunit alcohol dehydrogenase family)